MKILAKRGLSMLLALVLCVSVITGLSLTVSAEDAWLKNWGTRGELAAALSDNAEAFYTSNGVTYDELAKLSGTSDVSAVPESALYEKLQTLMASNHSTVTTYDATKEMFAYTDIQNSGIDSDKISSFYSGKEIGPTWDGNWNREHTWPNSKGLDGEDENDIMMLRPTASSENSSRGNKAYGESDGYYDPNTVSGGTYNLHGDVARIMLYVYVRWGNTANMWGTDGVIESVDVLLKWMAEDPVDTWELGRNDSVESITGTRNVFVDYPELAFLLFGEAVPGDMDTPSGEASSSEYTITAASNNTDWGTVSVSGRNIVAVPADGYYAESYTVVSGEAQVSQSGNIFTVTASSDCTIQINFAARKQLTVSFLQDGTQVSSQSVWQGDSVTLPAHSGEVPEDYTFLGWVTSGVNQTTEEPASVYAAGSRYSVDASVTFFALYSKVDSEAEGESSVYSLYSGELTEGDYLITYDGGAMKAAVSSNRLAYSEITVTNDAVQNPAADIIWHIAPTGDGYWTIFNESTSSYAASTGAKNKATLITSVTDNAKWTPSGDSTYEFVNLANDSAGVNRNLRRNGTYGFACYSTSTGGALTLYKAVSGTVYYTTSTSSSCAHANTTVKAAEAATCTKEGYTEGVYCEDCKSYISGHESLEALGHDYQGVVTAPTQTEQGYTTYTCTRCGDSYVADYTDSLGSLRTVSFVVPDGVEAIEDMTCGTSGITLPAPGTPTGDYTYTFAGWAEVSVDNVTEKPALYLAGETYKTDEDAVLYAVYTYAVGGTGESSYLLVEDASQLTAGSKIVIAAANADLALSITQNGNNRGTAAIVKNGDKTITLTDGVAELLLGEGTVDGTYSFYCSAKGGYLYAASGSKNYLRTQTTLDANGSFLITVNTDGTCDLVAQGSNTRNTLRYNPNNGNAIFSCYGSGQQAVSLYIETVDGTLYYTSVFPCTHEGGTEVRGQVDATCTAEGYSGDIHCADCGALLESGTATPVKDHELEYVAEKPATHYAGGFVEHYVCIHCGTLFEDAEGTQELFQADTGIPKGEHVYGEWLFDEEGHWKSCDCGHIADQGEHTYGDWVTVKASTDKTDGLAEKTCSVCGHKQTKVIPAGPAPTGDETVLGLWMILAVLSGAAVCVLTVRKKYHR